MSRHDHLTEEYEDEFQRLLLHYLNVSQRGEEIDRVKLRRDHPQHAQSICNFLDNQHLVQQAFGAFRPDATKAVCDATIDSGTRGAGRHSSEWSFTRLTEAEFPISFGPYSLLSEIDRGGMGIVFRAKHESLNRLVALKIMRSGEMASDEELRRFRVEAEASAAIDHPNIISIFEVGEVHGLVYFTMAYVEGQDLGALLRKQPMRPKEAARILVRVADAVAAAHRCGIIHRDLKPSNILIDRYGEPYLIDFGLAKQRLAHESLTCTGQVLGTPAYMAPEQARGDHLSAAGDIYSLGAVLYELVTRQPPFSGPAPFDILLQVLGREPPSPRKLNKQVPRDLERIIQRAMEKDPRERYESAEQLEADLQRFLIDEPIERPRVPLMERASTWGRREPVLVSHLFAIGMVLVTVAAVALFGNVSSTHTSLKIALLSVWGAGSFGMQQLTLLDRYRNTAHWIWAAFDVTIYTTLIYLADPPRGLLLIGYPMMTVASGLFYRIRFVVFVTGLCIAGFLVLAVSVDDPIAVRPDFCVIYVSGLIVLGLCLISMIRRVRGLSEYFEGGRK